MKTALITGVSGQGGAHLAKQLLAEGFNVVGTTRDTNQGDTSSLSAMGIAEKLTLRSLDMQNSQSVLDLIDQLRPDEIYHLAAPSSVARSFKEPAETIYSIALTTVNLLEAIRKTDKSIPCFVATSTEMFGNCDIAATKDTPHNPKSPYGIGKSCAHFQVRNYREAYGLFVCSGILSNFESPLRPKNYVTSKIVRTACQIALGEVENIELGNLSVRRDWGSAAEFMYAARLTLQQKVPDDYIIATGITHSLRDFLQMAFSSLGLDYREHLVVKDSLLRPLDIKQTLCNPRETWETLNWQASTPLNHVVFAMVNAELVSQVGPDRAAKIMNLPDTNVVTIGKQTVG